MDNNNNTESRLPIPPAAIQPATHYATYFTVRPGAAWGPRVIDDLELVLIIAGRFAFDWQPIALLSGLDDAGDPTGAADNRRRLEMAEGDLLLILPNEPHTFRHLSGAGTGVIGCLHLDILPPATHPLRRLQFAPALPRLTHTGGDPVLQTLFKQADEVFTGTHRFRQELLDAICREVWIRLAEHTGGHRPGGVTVRLEKMQLFLRERLAQPVGRRELARAFGIAPEHVDYLFRKELGLTPTAFLQRERVHAGLRLLQQGLSVKETAARVGIADPFYFSRLFKRLIGVPPSIAATG